MDPKHRSHFVDAIQLPIRVYFQYLPAERHSVQSGKSVDSPASLAQTHAEALLFHKSADSRSGVRLLITKGRPIDVGCVYSSIVDAACCIRARSSTNEHCLLELHGQRNVYQYRSFFDRLFNMPLLQKSVSTAIGKKRRLEVDTDADVDVNETIAALCAPESQYRAFVEAHMCACSAFDPIAFAPPNVSRPSSKATHSSHRFPDLRLSVAVTERVVSALEESLHYLCPTCISMVSPQDLYAGGVACQLCKQLYHPTCQKLDRKPRVADEPFVCTECQLDPESLFGAETSETHQVDSTNKAPKRRRHRSACGLVALPDMQCFDETEQHTSFQNDLKTIRQLLPKYQLVQSTTTSKTSIFAQCTSEPSIDDVPQVQLDRVRFNLYSESLTSNIQYLRAKMRETLCPPQHVWDAKHINVRLLSVEDGAMKFQESSVDLTALLQRFGLLQFVDLLLSQDIGAADLPFLSDQDWLAIFPDSVLGPMRTLQAVVRRQHVNVPPPLSWEVPVYYRPQSSVEFSTCDVDACEDVDADVVADAAD